MEQELAKTGQATLTLDFMQLLTLLDLLREYQHVYQKLVKDNRLSGEQKAESKATQHIIETLLVKVKATGVRYE